MKVDSKHIENSHPDDFETSNDGHSKQDSPIARDTAINAAPRVGKLDTLEDVRKELGRLYRAARRKSGPEPDAVVAAKLAYLLQAVARTIEGSEMEKRVANLEKKLGGNS